MARIQDFITGDQYHLLMGSRRQCRECGQYCMRHTMVYDKEAEGLVCPHCLQKRSFNVVVEK